VSSQCKGPADDRYHTERAPKRIYYFSIEWLIGRSLDNAVLNLGMRNTYEDATRKLGFVSK
jgi:starch phosphorylase